MFSKPSGMSSLLVGLGLLRLRSGGVVSFRELATRFRLAKPVEDCCWFAATGLITSFGRLAAACGQDNEQTPARSVTGWVQSKESGSGRAG